MKGEKVLAMVVVSAMILGTLVVIEKISDIDLIEEAEGLSSRMGIDYWQGTNIGGVSYTDHILNQTTEKLIYSTSSISIVFNGSAVAGSSNYLYKPWYKKEWLTGTGYVYSVEWRRDENCSGAIKHTPSTAKTKTTVLDRAGLWLVVPEELPANYALSKVNMSNMSYYSSIGGGWHAITGWFWVNASSWDITVSPNTATYDRNDSTTITVKQNGQLIEDKYIWVDIWHLDDSSDYNDKGASLIYHNLLGPSDDGTWTISNLYDYTHDYGLREYTFVAYADYRGTVNQYADYVYGDDNAGYGDGAGYNNTFGNTDIWTKFNNKILNASGTVVSQTTWSETTYKFATCGPFDPPEYLSDAENLTLSSGVPTFVVTNSSQFWNDSDYVNNNRGVEVNVSVFNYDDKPLKLFSASNVSLYNKSNRPGRTGSHPIDPDYYNVTVVDNYIIKITPNSSGVAGNKWGYNISTGRTWAAKGTVYVVVAANTVDNASEEWNGTAQFTLTTATYQIKWIDDDGTQTGYPSDNSNTDGVIPWVPMVSEAPIYIQFQIVSSDYEYYGAGTSTDARKAAENITFSGDSLFTGTLDTFPGFATSWFGASTSNAWRVPLIPLMAIGGGEITIIAHAWNKTLTKTLAVGETDYWKDGSVVTVTPNTFKIDQQDQLLTVTVKDAKGSANPYATCYLYYISSGVPDYSNPLTPSGGFTADSSGTYTWNFNLTQQTSNQTNTFAAIKAPRNLTIYVVATNAGYGYALIQMKPLNDFEVESSYTTLLAGRKYDNFYINTTIVGTNGTETPSTESTDRNNFHVRIINENGDDVTDTFDGSGAISASALSGDSDYSYVFDGVYCTRPGTYTLYAYNNTHDSEGYNWTIVVEQVQVSVDKSPLIWKYDKNMSATFTVTYNGKPVNGSLRIDNITDVGDYNKTWANCSFDGSTDLGGNDSIEIDEDALNNGVITIHDITANHLNSGEAEQYISFWFRPTNSLGEAGEYARAIGLLPVSVPSITPEQQYIPVGRTTILDVEVTGRGILLGDIFVRAHGCGVDQNGTSGTEGTDLGIVTFSLLPTATGNISFDVGTEDRTVDTKIFVTGWVLNIEVSPTDVDEGDEFTVTATKEGTTTAVVGASIKIAGIGTKTTDANGEAKFTAPEVTSDRTYTVTATAEGYAPDPDTITVRVINVPKLTIAVPTKVTGGSTFEVAVAKDTGDPVVGATVTFEGDTYTTMAGGVATLTAPTKEGSYPITATFGTFKAATATVNVTAGGGVPGFEVVTLLVALGVAFILLRRRRN
jgi:hypothetical protein